VKLEAETFLPFSRERVFRTYRDKLVELVPFLPAIRGIEVKERSDAPPVTRMVNVWHGGGDIPAAARAFLSQKMLSFTDHATWDEARWTCEWRMEAHSFREAVHAAGRNHFHEVDGGCRFVIDGELRIDGTKLPVPRFLASSAGATVAKFLVGVIRPNLMETAKGVERYLAAEAK
jgi:hypothetical protein